MVLKNSAVGFSYTTAYWGLIIPLIRLGIEMCILLLGIMSFTQNNYLMYGMVIIIKIFLGTSIEDYLLRNIYYARRGYIFTDEGYKKYFSNKSWYRPSTYSMDILPPNEKELVRIIKELEDAY